MSDKETDTITGKLEHETEKARLIITGDAPEGIWIPISVTPYCRKQGRDVTLEVELWWLEKEGLA